MKRNQVPKGENLCDHCTALCCHYFALPIDQPNNRKDFDYIRWYLLHKHVHVYVDHDDDWYVEFQTECEELLPDFGCGTYADRPQLCREHGWPAGSCEFFADPHQHLFRCVRDFEAYLDERGIDWRWKRRPTVKQEGEAQ